MFDQKKQINDPFWTRLSSISKFTLHTKTQSGRGEVVIENKENQLIFHEKGSWQEGTQFSNILRWTWQDGVISLEHLRRGTPTFLLKLLPLSNNTLSSEPHLCGRDTYFGSLHITPDTLHLQWQIIGPKKQEAIDCCYLKI